MLNQLRSVEVERRKWEEREARLVEQLDKIKGTTVGSDPCRGCIELESSRLRVHDLTSANEDQALLIAEQRAEIGLLQAKLARIEGRTPSTGASIGPCIATSGGAAAPMSSLSGGVVDALSAATVPRSTTAALPVTLMMSTTPSIVPPVATTTKATPATSMAPIVSAPPVVPLGGAVSHPLRPPLTIGSVPAVTLRMPAVTTLVPGVTTPLPAITAPAPAVTMPVPVITSPVPAVTMHVPAVTSPVPAVTLPVPAATMPAPVVAAPSPGVPMPVSTTPVPVTPPPMSPLSLSESLLASASILPQIPRFTGEEQSDGETVVDWLEQFESVAVLGGWSGHCKLVHLTTRLRGAAYSFYWSCSLEQRSDYTLLAKELKKRFTPVKLAAVQSQLFHDRKQGPKKSVDEFAQNLKKLFARAYAGVNRGGPEKEKMGQSVLANQFIAGLRSDLKSKVVGVEGSLEQLLLKARFEEAKKRELRELSLRTLPPPQKKLPVSGAGSTPRTTPATQNIPLGGPLLPMLGPAVLVSTVE